MAAVDLDQVSERLHRWTKQKDFEAHRVLIEQDIPSLMHVAQMLQTAALLAEKELSFLREVLLPTRDALLAFTSMVEREAVRERFPEVAKGLFEAAGRVSSALQQVSPEIARDEEKGRP